MSSGSCAEDHSDEGTLLVCSNVMSEEQKSRNVLIVITAINEVTRH